LGYWSRLGYVEDSDIQAAAVLPDIMRKDAEDANEDEGMW
jgi:hypothetical protein